MSLNIYGIHAVSTLLQRRSHRVLELFIQKDNQNARIKNIIILADREKIAVNFVHREQLNRKAENGNHQGIVARIQPSKILTEKELWLLLEDLSESPFLLILDCIQDPHNLGACLRSADAFGVHAVIVPKDKSASLTPVVRKIASGAAETIPFVQVTNLSRTMQALKKRNIWLVGADGEAQNELGQIDLPKSVAVVMGTEGTGLRRLTKDNCDLLVKIPMRGTVESLNVSVATGIFLFFVKSFVKSKG